MGRQVTAEGKRVRLATYHGAICPSVNVDGKQINFWRVWRSGWRRIYEHGNYNFLDFRDAHWIVLAGIRFRGAPLGTTLSGWSTGTWQGVGTSSGGMVSGSISMPTVPSDPNIWTTYGSIASAQGRGRMQLVTQHSPAPQGSIWINTSGPMTTYPPHTTTWHGVSPAGFEVSGVSNTGVGSDRDRISFGGQGRIRWWVHRMSKDCDIRFGGFGGWTGNYLFILSPGSIAPTTADSGPTTTPPDSSTLFWAIQPWVFAPKEINSFEVLNMGGQNRVDVEFFIVYF